MKKRTNKYWPIVFWMYDVSGGGILKYRPSDGHADRLRWSFTYDAALLHGLSCINNRQHARANASRCYAEQHSQAVRRTNPAQPVN
jgi:hypothetical protein